MVTHFTNNNAKLRERTVYVRFSNRQELKTDSNTRSKVLHIRNIQNDVTEDEIIALGYPFGKVTNVLILIGKEQAFIELDDMVSGIVDLFMKNSCFFYPLAFFS